MNHKSDLGDWRQPLKKSFTREKNRTKCVDISGRLKNEQLLLSVLNNVNTKPQAVKKFPHESFSIRERLSMGVACCRFNLSRVEMLMVCKRYTYAYYMFVHGKYNPSNNSEMIKWFSGMTIDEKHDIMSLNFMQMWYRIWLNNTTRNSNYFSAKSKFEGTFAIDGGARLHRLISKSTNAGKIWAIPKGRKKNRAEHNINCAVREFYEETRISKGSYKLWVDRSRSYSYIDDGIKYTNQYYLAFTKHNIEPRIDFSAKEQIEEVSDIRWMDIEEIRRVDETGRLAPFIKPIFNFIKKHAKK